MKSRRGGRGTAVVLRVDCLVAVPVLQLMGDVRRQRHLAQLVQDLLKDSFEAELHKAVSFFRLPDDSSFQKSVPELDDCACTAFLPGLHQGFPDVVFFSGEKQDLDLRAGPFLHADEPRRDHLGVVDHQAVPASQILFDVPEGLVFRFPSLPVQDHQPRGSPVFQGILRDEFLREFVIKIR